MSITQQLAHWFIDLGLDPALSVLFTLILLVAIPLMIAAGIVAIFEEDEDDHPRIVALFEEDEDDRPRSASISGRSGVRL